MRISLKRILTAMLSALCIATVFFTSLTLGGGAKAAASSVSAATMTGDYVHLRSGAGTDFSIIGNLSSGELITVLDNSNAEWSKVQTSSGAVGYCSKSYVKTLSALPEEGQGTGVLSGNFVNLRSGAGTDHPVIAMLYKNDTVTVLDNSNEKWVKVQTESGQVGYCNRMFLQISGPAEAQTEAAASLDRAVTQDYLNLRAGAGFRYGILTVLAKGSVVEVLDDSDATWTKIRTNDGKVGYCSKDYLKAEAEPTEITLSETEKTVAAGENFILTATISDESKPAAVSTNAGVVQATYLRREGNAFVYQINALKAGMGQIQIHANGASSGVNITVQAARQTASDKASVIVDYLNIRSSKGTDSPIIGGLTEGAAVTVLDSSDSDWIQIQTAGSVTGYVYREYLAMETAEQTATVDADVLNVRRGRGVNTAVMGTVRQGETVSVLSSADSNWLKVRTAAGTEGYAAGEYLSLTATSYENTPATVKASVLNIRNGRGTNYAIVGMLWDGEEVTVLDSSDSSWIKIKTDSGLIGYVAGAYLDMQRKSEENLRGRITADMLNVRRGKSTYAAIIDMLKRDETVAVLDNSDAQWVKVQSDSGTVGYVYREYITLQEETVEDPAGESSENTPAEPEYAQVTADVLNIRSGMGTQYARIGTAAFGQVLQVLDNSNAGWAKIKTTSGLEGYVSKEYLGKVGENQPNNSNSSNDSASTGNTLPVGKTLYLAGTTGAWYSSNNQVATVSNGYVTGVGPGTCTITGPAGTSYTITVTQSEPVRTAYTSPNIAEVGRAVQLVAVTDDTRDSVQFSVKQSDGSTKVVTANVYTTEDCNGVITRVWKASTILTSAGRHQIEAFSSQNGVMSATGFITDAYTVQTTDANTSTHETRRISDEMIERIAAWEGYRATVYGDSLAGGIPTIGYGQTFTMGTQFYNNMSKTEAWSLLIKSINAGRYTTEVNRFLETYNMKASQSQFDALVSFSYNIGAGHWNSSSEMDLREIMKNAVVPPQIAAGRSLPGSVTFEGAKLYGDKDRTATVLRTVSQGVNVSVLQASYDDAQKAGWYKVQLADGTVGYMSSAYVRFDDSVEVEHDLNYADAHAFGSEMLLWHHASKTCYAGLVYRRLGEAKVFSYGDYSSATPGNYEYQRNTYGVEIPACLQSKNWIQA